MSEKICQTCSHYIGESNECSAFLSTLIFIYDTKIPKTMTVRVFSGDTCFRWSEHERQTET